MELYNVHFGSYLLRFLYLVLLSFAYLFLVALINSVFKFDMYIFSSTIYRHNQNKGPVDNGDAINKLQWTSCCTAVHLCRYGNHDKNQFFISILNNGK